MSTYPTPLNDEQLCDYYREGYLVVRDLVPTASIDKMLAEVPDELGKEAGGTWSPSTFKHDDPTRNAPLHRLLVEPSVIGAVEQIFEAPAHIYYGMVAIVPAQGGTGLPWHQDNQYSLVLCNALNVFIACCEITPDKAMLWVAPGSHQLGRQPSRKAGGRHKAHRTAVEEPENGILLDTLQKGDAVIFDRSTYHRSLENETDSPRYAYAAQYQASYAREAKTGRKDPKRMPARQLREQLIPLID